MEFIFSMSLFLKIEFDSKKLKLDSKRLEFDFKKLESNSNKQNYLQLLTNSIGC